MKKVEMFWRAAIVLAAAPLCAQNLAAGQEQAASPFDVVALVDSLDFAKHFDIETATGTVQTLEHVLLTHANDIWWRDKGGGRMRYPSKCEMWQFSEAPFDKKRLPSEDIYGYLRLESHRGNEFPLVREECRRRKLGFGIHTTIEENHWYSPLSSNWTLAHPEFWCCTRDGDPWMGSCSIMYPEVIEHKLAMLDERLALKPQKIMLDSWRNGAWSFAREYTAPAIAEWKRLYGGEPVPEATDPRWQKMVGAHFDDYLRRFSAKCRAAGVEFIGGFVGVDDKDDASLRNRYCGFSWRHLAKEGVFDAVYVMSVSYDPKDPFGSTERIYRNVMANRGKAKVYFPLASYNFEKCGISEYAKLTKLSEAEVTKRLMKMARDAGARGVVLECVDYGNYRPEICNAIAESLSGKDTDADSAGVRKALKPYIERHEIPGYVSVLIDGEREEWVADGWSDIEKRVPMTKDSLFRICSQTKGIVGAAAAKLVVEGKLTLDDPVSKYLPEFAKLERIASETNGTKRLVPVKNVLTVRDCLSHTGGFPFETRISQALGWAGAPLRVAAAAGASTPLLFEPGTSWKYSNAGIDVAGAVVEAVTGERIEDHLKRVFFDPLGMKDTTFRPTAEQLKRLVSLYYVETNKACRLMPKYRPLPEPYTSPDRWPSCGAGLFSTPRDLLEFYRMLAFDGVARDGRRIMPQRAISELLAVKQTPPGVKTAYSLGMFVEGEWFGHDGALKTAALLNPKRHSVWLWMMQCEYPGRINRWHQYRVWKPAVNRFFEQNTGKGSNGETP